MYAGHGNEGTYPYLASAIEKKCAIPPTSLIPFLNHKESPEGRAHTFQPGGYRWQTFKSIEENEKFTQKMNDNAVFMDSYAPVPGGNGFKVQQWTGRGNIYSSPEHRENLFKKFGIDDVTMEEKARIELHDFLKKEFFVTKDYIDYENINNILLGD